MRQGARAGDQTCVRRHPGGVATTGPTIGSVAGGCAGDEISYTLGDEMSSDQIGHWLGLRKISGS
jgi:hypothetical protein